jgi:hypothetical protein
MWADQFSKIWNVVNFIIYFQFSGVNWTNIDTSWKYTETKVALNIKKAIF